MDVSIHDTEQIQPTTGPLYRFLESYNFSVDASAPSGVHDQRNGKGKDGNNDRDSNSGDNSSTWLAGIQSSHPDSIVPARAMSDVLHDRSIGTGFGRGFDDMIVDWVEDARRRSLHSTNGGDDRSARPTQQKRSLSYMSAQQNQRRYSAANNYFKLLNGVKNRPFDRYTNEEAYAFNAVETEGNHKTVSNLPHSTATSTKSNPFDFQVLATTDRLDDRAYFGNASLSLRKTPVLNATASTTDSSVADLQSSFVLPPVQAAQDASIDPTGKGEENLFETLIQQQMNQFHFDTFQSNNSSSTNTASDGVVDPLSAYPMDKTDDLLQWLGKQPGVQESIAPTALQIEQDAPAAFSLSQSAHRLKRQKTNSDYHRSSPDNSFLIQL